VNVENHVSSLSQGKQILSKMEFSFEGSKLQKNCFSPTILSFYNKVIETFYKVHHPPFYFNCMPTEYTSIEDTVNVNCFYNMIEILSLTDRSQKSK